MNRLPLFHLLHGLAVLALLLPAKVAKLNDLAPDLPAGQVLALVLPDVLFATILALAGLGLANLWVGWWARWTRALLGLSLVPLMAVAVTEQRFYVSSGSFLDWQLLLIGLSRLDEIKGVVGAEISPLWGALLGLSLPVGLAQRPARSHRVGGLDPVAAFFGLARGAGRMVWRRRGGSPGGLFACELVLEHGS